MPPLLNHFVSKLSLSRDFNAFKEAFCFVSKAYNLGRIEVITNGNIIILFSDDSFIKEDCVKVEDETISFIAYKKNENVIWDNSNIKTLLEIALSFFKANYYSEKLLEAPYIQFSTNLPNIYGFEKLVNERFSKEELINEFAIVTLNIKGFNLINRFHSLDYSKKVLVLVAKEIQKIIDDEEILVHQGSDTFIALVRQVNLSRFIDYTNAIYIDINNKEGEEDRFLSIFFTKAVVLIDHNFSEFAEFIYDSSVAIAYARANNIAVLYFNQKLKNDIEKAKSIELTIDEEIANGNIIVYYQPKVDAFTGKIIGAEALARYEKDGNIISPSVFVPILERTGNIAKLDLFILDKACSDISFFRKLGNKTVPLSCNISRKDLLVAGFYRKILDIIRKYDLEFEDIVIEVTETTSEEESKRMQDFINYLHNHSVKTSLDDFGTGYSTLSALRDFEVNEIKIDRTFIEHIIDYKKDAIILANVVELANKLGLEVVCEGVETFEQLKFLKSLGCRTIQGYYFDKPLPKPEFEAKLKKEKYNKAI